MSGAWFGRMPASPETVGTVTESTSASRARRSGVTISNLSISCYANAQLRDNASCILHTALPRLGSRWHLLRLLSGLLDRADHVKRLLRHVVAFALENLAKAFDRIFDFYVLALETGELLTDEKRLREETLDLA